MYSFLCNIFLLECSEHFMQKRWFKISSTSACYVIIKDILLPVFDAGFLVFKGLQKVIKYRFQYFDCSIVKMPRQKRGQTKD